MAMCNTISFFLIALVNPLEFCAMMIHQLFFARILLCLWFRANCFLSAVETLCQEVCCVYVCVCDAMYTCKNFLWCFILVVQWTTELFQRKGHVAACICSTFLKSVLVGCASGISYSAYSIYHHFVVCVVLFHPLSLLFSHFSVKRKTIFAC